MVRRTLAILGHFDSWLRLGLQWDVKAVVQHITYRLAGNSPGLILFIYGLYIFHCQQTQPQCSVKNHLCIGCILSCFLHMTQFMTFIHTDKSHEERNCKGESCTTTEPLSDSEDRVREDARGNERHFNFKRMSYVYNKHRLLYKHLLRVYAWAELTARGMLLVIVYSSLHGTAWPGFPDVERPTRLVPHARMVCACLCLSIWVWLQSGGVMIKARAST